MLRKCFLGESVFQVIAPCEVVCKLFGQIPLFSGVDLPAWKRCLNAAYFLMTISLIMRGIWYCLPIELSQASGTAVVRKSGALIDVVYYVQPICASVTGQLVAQTTQKVFKSLETVDKKFKTLGYGHSYVKERNVVLASTICALALSSGVLLMYKAESLEGDMEFTIVNLCFLVYYSMAGTYASCAAYLVFNRLRAVKDAIRAQFPLCRTTDEYVITVSKQVIRSEDQKMALKQVKLVLEKLNSTIELMNRSFSVQISYCVGVTFVIGIVCSFLLIRAVIYRNDRLVMGTINFIWYMYYLLFILSFVALGSRIAKEGRRIGITVHKAMSFCNTSRTVVNELTVFSQQLLYLKPVITCGLFVYDWSLLYTMLATTATYLIIMIQFDVSFPSLQMGKSAVSTP